MYPLPVACLLSLDIRTAVPCGRSVVLREAMSMGKSLETKREELLKQKSL
jgi:hypothetical protein